MGFSPLANMKRRIPDVGRSSTRTDRIKGVMLHHNAGVDAFGQATARGREVSAHYWITNSGDILPNIDENRRAWTSGHPAYPAGAQADHRFITFEISNSRSGSNWPISDKALWAVIRLIADIFKRHNLGRVTRGTLSGLAVHRDFVATECPGGYVMSKLDFIIKEANKLISGGSPGGSGGLTMSEVKEIKKHIDAMEARLKGPSWFGWVKGRQGGSGNGESFTSMLNRILRKLDEPVDIVIDTESVALDVVRILEESNAFDGFADKVVEGLTEDQADLLIKKLGEKLSRK